MTIGNKQQKFWDRVAARYAARPLKNVPAYEAMLADIAERLQPDDRVLELGCGTGGTAIRLAPLVTFWTASDFSPNMIHIAQAKQSEENLSFIVADAKSALAAGSFNVVCAINVLHLVENFPDALAQIYAHLPPGGSLILKIWCFADMSWRIKAVFSTLSLLGLFPTIKKLRQDDVCDALHLAGFVLEAKTVFGDYPQNPYFVLRKPDTSIG